MNPDFPKSVPYEAAMAHQLQDADFATRYLNECLNEEEDLTLFLNALRQVIDARGLSVGQLSESTHLNRENLYRILSNKGNPEWRTLRRILSALGLSFEVKSA